VCLVEGCWFFFSLPKYGNTMSAIWADDEHVFQEIWIKKRWSWKINLLHLYSWKIYSVSEPSQNIGFLWVFIFRVIPHPYMEFEAPKRFSNKFRRKQVRLLHWTDDPHMKIQVCKVNEKHPYIFHDLISRNFCRYIFLEAFFITKITE
jgi:hypothetical protein